MSLERRTLRPQPAQEPLPPVLWPAAEWIVAGIAAVLAVAVWAAWPVGGNYDTVLDLVWARELLDGQRLGFEAYAASTPHPAWLALGVPVVALLGDDGDRAMVLVTALSLPLLAAATVRLGRLVGEAVARPPAVSLRAGEPGTPDPELSARRARVGLATGLLAGLLTLSSFPFLLLAARGYLDLPFLALVAWAAALVLDDVRGTSGPTYGVGQRSAADGEVGRPRPPEWRRPALLLAVAGLLRPEAWLLAGVHWLWCTLRGRWAAADDRLAGRGAHLALVLAPPLLWMAVDAVVAGDPLHSLTATSQLAEDLGRDRGIARAPRVLVTALADQARPPVALGGAIGLAVLLAGSRLGLHRPPRRAALVVVALLGGGIATFLAAGVAGLSLLPRYLTVPSVALTVLAALAVTGWLALPPDARWRAPWAAAAAVGAVLGVAGYVALKHDAASRLTSELRFLADVRRDARALADDPRVAAGRRCGPISLPTYRLVPDLRLHLHADGDEVVARSDPGAARLGVARAGVAISIATDEEDDRWARRYGRADGVPRSTQPAPPGFRVVARHGALVASVRCPPGRER